ncbi:MULTISPECIES: response regulator transcription factor [Caproicibacterium]|uniref:Stage 0 sporulation protein A homolog n=1 Tax=Caproicibacterium argilliputei TaxID=3030016 RepID=A0AA97DAE3_9FIRM|nr:response regulator transcription factor [Caproicibacterium argilliputei]WOC33266.1 response regulator transcription factor [Caproicibacterium argilliputei]
MALVYIADDELNIRRLVAFGLKDAGFETGEFPDGESLLQGIRLRRPDAVLLDWMMPGTDGLQICRALRENEQTRAIPVLMLTAKGEEIDKVLGLEMGADDYITKPFGMKELCARVRAVLRRAARQEAPAEQQLSGCGIRVDITRHTVHKNGEAVELTAKEFDLLCTLMRHAGKVLTRDALLDKVWGIEYFGDTRTVDVHVRYLRQKIEDDPDDPARILTVRGVGYKFCAQEETGT